MGVVKILGFLWSQRRKLRFLYWVAFWLCVALVLFQPVAGLRPLRERARSWGDEVGIRIFGSFCFCAQFDCIWLFVIEMYDVFRVKTVNFNVEM